MNLCERLATMRRSDRVELSDLPSSPMAADAATSGVVQLPAEGMSLDELVISAIVQALERSGWNQARAARFLRLPRHILLYRMEKYGITPPKDRAG